jgi:hypothetical protein
MHACVVQDDQFLMVEEEFVKGKKSGMEKGEGALCSASTGRHVPSPPASYWSRSDIFPSIARLTSWMLEHSIGTTQVNHISSGFVESTQRVLIYSGAILVTK